MNKFLTLSVAVLIALTMWACVNNTGNSTNGNTNTGNSNTNATASKAAPALDTLMSQEKAANEAYTKGDGQFFQGFLSDKFMMNDMGKMQTKTDAVKAIGDVKCDVKSINLSEGKLSKIDDDNYAVVYKSEADGTCKFNGKDEKIPSPMRAATVWTRGSGDKWQPVWHGETAIVDPKNMPKPPAGAPPTKEEKPASNANGNANSNSSS